MRSSATPRLISRRPRKSSEFGAAMSATHQIAPHAFCSEAFSRSVHLGIFSLVLSCSEGAIRMFKQDNDRQIGHYVGDAVALRVAVQVDSRL